MRIPIRMSMVLAPLLAALALGGAAHARSPDATRMPTPSPSPTPTVAPSQLAEFSGSVWLPPVNNRAVTAKIGDVVCASTCPGEGCMQFPIDPAPVMIPYNLNVVAQEVKPGCGYEGVTVTFFMGDKQADQAAVWHAGSSQTLNLSTGPLPAYFQGRLIFSSGIDSSLGKTDWVGIGAYVDGNMCGQSVWGIWRDIGNYGAIVKSAQEQAGCGTEGAQVTFKLRDGQGNIVGAAREKGVWHAWGQGNTGQTLDLTMEPVTPIKPGSVGDGSMQSGQVPWIGLAFGLSVAGALGMAAAAAVRRKAAPR
jgi:hypothetical protein